MRQQAPTSTRREEELVEAAPRSLPEDTSTPKSPQGAERISIRAYELWTLRGCPIGSPEIDWAQAEAELATVQTTVSKSQAA